MQNVTRVINFPGVEIFLEKNDISTFHFYLNTVDKWDIVCRAAREKVTRLKNEGMK